MERQLKLILIRFLLTAILLSLGCWTVYFNWPQRAIRFNNYSFQKKRRNDSDSIRKPSTRMACTPGCSSSQGRAAGFFRQAVSQDVLFLDAWLRLAETEAAQGNEEKAKAILTYIADMTEQVFAGSGHRCCWPVNWACKSASTATPIISCPEKCCVQDALQLLHTHLGGEASAVIAVLEPAKSGRLSRLVDALGHDGRKFDRVAGHEAVAEPDKETALRYAHFLLNHKRVIHRWTFGKNTPAVSA
jgi:hypothetical protein